MTHEYKIGDILCGNVHANQYGITRQGVYVRVIKVLGDRVIIVQVLDRNLEDSPRYGIFMVDSRCFDLHSSSQELSEQSYDSQAWQQIMDTSE